MKHAAASGRAFTVAMTISLLFHLSAVTLFRIVVYFPRYDIEYFDVSIVETRVPIRPLATAVDTPDAIAPPQEFERCRRVSRRPTRRTRSITRHPL